MHGSNIQFQMTAMKDCPDNILYFIQQDDVNKARDRIENLREAVGKTPPRKPGDEYTVFGALVGVVTGIIAGIYFGLPWVFIVGVIGGGIAGTFIGSWVGAYVTKNRK